MKKLCPFHRYDILHITQWLNEQSSYGWELKSWGTLFCKFQEYDGSRYQYQLDMDNREDGANEERRKELEALGWEYADTIPSTRLHIYRSLDWNASIPENKEFTEYNLKKFRFLPMWVLVNCFCVLVTLMLQTPLFLGMRFFILGLTRTDQTFLMLYGIYAAAFIVVVLDDFRHRLQLYRYLRKKARGSVSITVLKTEQEYDNHGFHFPLQMVRDVLLFLPLVLLLITLWSENQKEYTEGFFAERYYEGIDSVYEPFENYNAYGSYWMNVSEAVEDELFDQIVERYAGYSTYYGNGFFLKSKYDTHDQWNIEWQKDGRFEKLVIAEKIPKNNGEKMIFAQIGNDIIYLRCYREPDISGLLEELTKIEI